MLFLCSEVDPHDLREEPFGLEFAEEFERIEDFGFIPLVPCSGEWERGVVDDELIALVRGVIEREDIGIKIDDEVSAVFPDCCSGDAPVCVDDD